MNERHKPSTRQSGTEIPQPASADEPTVLFVSDTHFHQQPDAAESARLEKFLQLMKLACDADQLVLLGDIFDFWFDYPHFRLKGYDRLLHALDTVRDAGTQIHFIGGNHDIWAADFFHQRFGCSPDCETETIQFGSRRVLLSHGDGLLKFDWAYNSFRAMVRTRLGIVLAKSLHPEILHALSAWLSGQSRAATRDEASLIEERAQRWFDRQITPAWDLMVTGHVHHGFRLERGPVQMVALAGWFAPLSYGLLQGGQFQLLDFDRDAHPGL